MHKGIVKFLSGTPQWREMAIFVAEDDAQGGGAGGSPHDRSSARGAGPS
jgi:hypothetical protein